MDSNDRNRWFHRLDSDERSTLRNLGLLVVGFGAVVSLMLSSFSHDVVILMFGLGPAMIGIALVFFSFVPVPTPPPGPQAGILWLLFLAVTSMNLIGHRFPAKLWPYIAVPFYILMACLWFWRPARRPTNSRE